MNIQIEVWFWRLVRWGYAGYFIFVGLFILRGWLRGGAAFPTQPNALSQAFTDTLFANGFIRPVLVATYLGGGLALIFLRTAPLGLALLGPSVVIIFFFHTVMTGKIAWGAGWGAVWMLMVWRYRKGFAPLWNYKE